MAGEIPKIAPVSCMHRGVGLPISPGDQQENENPNSKKPSAKRFRGSDGSGSRLSASFLAILKPNQRKGQNKKFMNFDHLCEFWCFPLGRQARFASNFGSGAPPGKVHELAFLWFAQVTPDKGPNKSQK